MPKPTLSKLHFTSLPGELMYRRFCVDFKSSNKDIFESIRYLHVGEIFKEFHIVCYTDNNKVVGDLALQQSPFDDDIIWLKHVSVAEKFRNMGICKQLLATSIDYVRQNGKTLEVSSYSEMGNLYLEPLIQKAISDNPDLTIIDENSDRRAVTQNKFP